MSLRGRALAPDGRPAAEAEVIVVANLPRPLTMTVETSRVLAQARTDAEGRFRVELPRTALDRCCMAGVVAYRPGYSAGLHDLGFGDREEVTIRLGPEEPVQVRLLDLEGRPAGRARVRVIQLWTSGPAPSGLFLTTAPDRALPAWLGFLDADEDGRLTIPGLPRDAEVILETLDDRFAVQRIRFRTGQATARSSAAAIPTFTLTPAHRLVGRVRLGESGPGAPQASVIVIGHKKAEDAPGGIWIRGQTGATGRFSLAVPRCDNYEVLVYPPEGSPFVFRRAITAATQGVSQELDVTLPRGVLARGRVVESPSGRAVAGAILEYRPRPTGNPNFREGAIAGRGGYEPTAVTGPDGSFRLGVLPGPGHLLVKAPTPGYIAVESSLGELETGNPGGPRLYPDGLLAVDAPAGAEVEASITLRRGATVRGRIIDPEGRPAVDAGLFTRSANNVGFGAELNLLPAEDGHFELTGLDTERPTAVFFLDTKHQLARIVEFAGRDDDRAVAVQLHRCGSARARFVDTQGRPFANMRLSTAGHPMIGLEMLAADRAPGPRGVGPELEVERTLVDNLDFERYSSLISDAEGRVAFPTLIPGATYRIMAGEGGWVMKKQFVAEAGRVIDLGNITVSPGR